MVLHSRSQSQDRAHWRHAQTDAPLLTQQVGVPLSDRSEGAFGAGATLIAILNRKAPCGAPAHPRIRNLPSFGI